MGVASYIYALKKSYVRRLNCQNFSMVRDRFVGNVLLTNAVMLVCIYGSIHIAANCMAIKRSCLCAIHTTVCPVIAIAVASSHSRVYRPIMYDGYISHRRERLVNRGLAMPRRRLTVLSHYANVDSLHELTAALCARAVRRRLNSCSVLNVNGPSVHSLLVTRICKGMKCVCI